MFDCVKTPLGVAFIAAAVVGWSVPTRTYGMVVTVDASRRLDDAAGGMCVDVTHGAHTNDTRMDGAAALYLLEHGGDASVALSLLERQFTAQNMDRSSPLYGQVVSPATPTDYNNTVFASQVWAPILERYHRGLSEASLAEIRSHAAAALVYLQNHPVGVDYTNIHLLNSEQELVYGDLFGDATAVRRGTAGITQWFDAVSRDGVHEYESPTYVTVDMDAFYEGALLATDPSQRYLFTRGLDFLWSETLANLFRPKMRIAGAESRSYDPLHGADEPLAVKLNYAGFDAPIHDATRLRCFDTLSLLQDGSSYEIPQQVRSLVDETPRVVEERWGDAPSQTKYTYITDAFAIGSANGDEDATDRIAAIDFAGGGPSLPTVRVIGDVTGYWYGPTPTTQRDGGRVWNHAATRPSVVQRHNFMLVLTDLDGGVTDEGAPLTVNVVIPALSSGVAVGGEPVATNVPFQRTVNASSAVTVRVGETVAAARIVYAERAPGTTESLRLEATADSISKGAARLAATQSSATPTGARDLRGIILLGVDSGDGARTVGKRLEDAKITQSRSGSLWTVSAEMSGHRFSSTYDLATHASVRRTIDGEDVSVSSPLIVNGRAISP